MNSPRHPAVLRLGRAARLPIGHRVRFVQGRSAPGPATSWPASRSSSPTAPSRRWTARGRRDGRPGDGSAKATRCSPSSRPAERADGASRSPPRRGPTLRGSLTVPIKPYSRYQAQRLDKDGEPRPRCEPGRSDSTSTARASGGHRPSRGPRTGPGSRSNSTPAPTTPSR
ncbi:MAG: hypothetical protein MZV63_65315 [Marinilabiliales bacterium]|nr:hypothetical protein [Marinilabiliales bacterium]